VKFLEHDRGKTGPAGPWVIQRGELGTGKWKIPMDFLVSFGSNRLENLEVSYTNSIRED
jgi:hypothetical protein